MIILAYDGSLNGDWVSRYAMRFAAHKGSALLVLHVRDNDVGDDQLHVKLQRLERESQALGVECFTEVLPEEKSVYFTLLKQIPEGTENIVVCGTRVRSRQRRFLTGTISEKLLRTGHFPVLALRVVQPGLLGTPRDLLLPLAGHPRGFESVWPFFRLLLPEVDRLFLLRCLQVGPLRLPHLSMLRREAMRQAGERYLSGIADEIQHRRGCRSFHLDWRIAICDDWVREVLIHASRLKVRMLLLGATERPMGHRLLHGNTLERVLAGTPCDVGIYRSL
jgi:nucleotide-binding universal stress UspA family protein